MKVNPRDPSEPAQRLASTPAGPTVRGPDAPKHGSESPEGPEREEAIAPEAPPKDGELEQAIEMANELARKMNLTISFRPSEHGDEMILQLKDRETGEVIREVPPEEMIRRMRDFSGFEGLLTQGRG